MARKLNNADRVLIHDALESKLEHEREAHLAFARSSLVVTDDNKRGTDEGMAVKPFSGTWPQLRQFYKDNGAPHMLSTYDALEAQVSSIYGKLGVD